MLPEFTPLDRDRTLKEVTGWFFDDYLTRWIAAGAAGNPPDFIADYWASPLWVGGPDRGLHLAQTQDSVVDLLDGLHKRLAAASYDHTMVPDSRVTVFHPRGAAIDVVWSRRRGDESEIERLAVHFVVAKSEIGWRAVSIQTGWADAGTLDEIWPAHRGLER